MKKLILASAIILLIGHSAFAQPDFIALAQYRNIAFAPHHLIPSRDMSFALRSIYSRSIKKEKLDEAKFISDVIPGYPVNWITSYVSVEISATSGGKAIKASSTDDVLTAEQKNILNTPDMGTDIVVDARYKYYNPSTNLIENNQIHTSVRVVPDKEAEYIGGYEQMMKYFNNEIFERFPRQFQLGRVKFTINENGEITNAKISMTSGDVETDKLLIEAINKMPKWKPAENSKGIKVKQEFEFGVGNDDGC